MTEYKRVEINELERSPRSLNLEALVDPSQIIDPIVKYNQMMKSQIPDNQRVPFIVRSGIVFSSNVERFLRRACKYDSIIVVRGRSGGIGFSIDSAEYLHEPNTLSLADGKKGELSLADEHDLSLIK